ncbi:GNAT family N-acetyltransferase [Kocuria rhizophila]|uniref:GNAT family N-acetyltransferase n=1 Tax=Kocuria rhizophila TaxID=72000 RepID=UPI001E376F64|nr:GNAT family N-acetyltransferase [Kocuria rhizophila]
MADAAAAPRSEPVIRACRGPQEHPALVRICRSAVEATHDFLSVADREASAAHLEPDCFPAVELTVATLDGEPVGFVGTLDGSLEMLFVSDDHRGRGIESSLLAHVRRERGVTAVDVNEQNPGAVGFYEHHGFRTVGRNATDEAGCPYPILHLALAPHGSLPTA